MSTTFERLQAILINNYHFKVEELPLDAPLQDLGFDSLATAELLFSIEDEFDMTLPPETVQLSTLGEVVAFIDDLVNTQGASGTQTTPLPGLATPAR
jgi:acyl carrier protein